MLARLLQLVPREMALIEVQMTAMLQPQIRSTGQHQRQVGIAMTVAITHAAAKQ